MSNLELTLNLMSGLQKKKDKGIASKIAENILIFVENKNVNNLSNNYFLNTSHSFLTASTFLISQTEYPELLSFKSLLSLPSLYFRLLARVERFSIRELFNFYLRINPNIKTSNLILFEAQRTINFYLIENNLVDSKEASDRRLDYFDKLLPLPEYLNNIESSNCNSCKYFDGNVYGGNYFNCCVHPSGKKDCLDWKAK